MILDIENFLYEYIKKNAFQIRINDEYKSISKNKLLKEDIRNITYLHFWNKDLESITEEIGSLKKLKTLKLTKNKLSFLPSTIVNLTELEELDISENHFAEFPFEVLKLENLKSLKLEKNRLEYLPQEIVNLNLTEYEVKSWIKGNDFVEPSEEIISNGMDAIKVFFEELEKGKKKLNEIKVLIVGDGEAGKTSLVNRIIHNRFNKNEKQTDGIKIDSFNFKNTVNDSEEVKANFWDFGGQEIMSSTHQFFLSNRSFYILLLNGRKEEKAEKWLKMIQNFGGESEIFIVINKIDENPSASINEKSLRRKYPNIRDVFKISCKTGKGIVHLRRELLKVLSDINIVNEYLPASWFKIKEELELENRDYINQSCFDTTCSRYGVSHSNNQNVLVEFLHDLGVVVHFSNLHLNHLYIINPIWATEAVYKIINSQELADGKGTLSIVKLNQILNIEKYPLETHGYIIELMKKFELCYSIDASDETILIPDLLTIEEPNFNFDKKNLINLRISYDYLPKGVISRFIVKEHNRIFRNLVWRNGCVLDSGNTYAEIYCDDEDELIEIQVYGESPRELLNEIRTKFKEINDRFHKNKIEERIVLPDNSLATVKLLHLLHLKKISEKYYMSEETNEKYLVDELLEGIKPITTEERDIMEGINITVNGDANIGERGTIIKDNTFNEEVESFIKEVEKANLENKDEILKNIDSLKNEPKKLKEYIGTLGGIGSITSAVISLLTVL